MTHSTGDGKLTDRGSSCRPTPPKIISCDSERVAEALCVVARVDVAGAPTMVTWRDVRHRYKGIAQQAVPQPALYMAVATGLTGLTARTRLRPPTHRPTSRGAAVAAPAAGAGPSAAERGPAGRRATRL